MQPTYAMDDIQWNELIQDVAYYFNDLALKRGFQYYKQSRVHSFTMTEPRKFKTLVDGNEDYRVSIDLDNPAESHCDCPVQGSCKHMAASLMYYAERQGRPVLMLANAKAVSPLPKIASAKPAIHTVSAQERLAQLKKRASELPAAGIAEWRDFFEQCISPLDQHARNPRYAENALAAIIQHKPQMSPVTEKLFLFHANLFLLDKLIKPWGSSGGTASSLGYYAHLAVSDLQNAILRLLNSSLPLSSEPEEWPRVAGTLSALRHELLTESRSRFRDRPFYTGCYDLFWRNWICPNASVTELYSEEIGLLRQAEAELGAALSRQSWLLAQSKMYFYLSDDPAAWALLNEAAERPGLYPEELVSFLAPLSDAGEWSRLLAWLVEIGPMLRSSRFYDMEDYSAYWEEVVRQIPEAEPRMWSTLNELLPFSREIYTEKLLLHEKWQEWMDYHLSAGMEPADFRVKDLQPLEKNAPEMLLPFYHQAAERFVLEKNRHSYKAAVKLLKRLAKIYKKIKREERWEQFLESFTARHSRLRALQEELRKGKLIP